MEPGAQQTHARELQVITDEGADPVATLLPSAALWGNPLDGHTQRRVQERHGRRGEIPSSGGTGSDEL
jgi:hypothetical protein